MSFGPQSILIRWTKGFKCSGVEGEDVVKLLKEAIDRRGVCLTYHNIHHMKLCFKVMEAKETLISGLRWFWGTFSLPQQSLFIQYSASQNLLSSHLHHSENMQPDLFLSR